MLGTTYEKITSMSCCATESGFDLIGGLQKSSVNHDECRSYCSSYDWCYGIRITYENAIAGRREIRGVHSEKCRLLTPGADITLDGWIHLNKNTWKEYTEWKDCGAYSGYNCYRKVVNCKLGLLIYLFDIKQFNAN